MANLPPVLVDPPDQLIPSSQETVVIPLTATDPDADDVLTFSAVANSSEYHLDQSIRLTFTGDFSLNFGGLNEKWLLGDGGQEWYYILPSGQLWQWNGGATTNASLIASLHPDVYDNPALLYDAVAGNGPAAVAVENGSLSIDPVDGFSGSFSIDVTVSDGSLSDTQQLVVTVNENRAPMLVDPGPQSLLTTQGSLSVPLTASDPDGDVVVLSATAHSGVYYLDQEIDLHFTGDYSFNFGGLEEKWLVGGDDQWYYLLPNGTFWHWLGGATKNAEFVAPLSTATYADPSNLYEADPGGAPADIAISDSTLTVTPDAGFRGIFAVDVTASDDELSDIKRILVTVTGNQAPVLTELGSLTLPVTQDLIQTALEASDADGDLLTFTAIPHSAEYQLDQTIGLNFTGDLSFDFGGLEEKWLLADDNNTWYYITPDGGLWRWRSGPARNADFVTTLDVATYGDPSRLYDAEPGVAPATTSIAGTILTIDPQTGFQGIFGIEIVVSDGTDTDSELVQVEVTPPPNEPPVLTPPGNQTLPTTQDTLDVTLAATDPEGAPLTFTANAHSGEYYLDQTIGLNFTGDYSFNFAGLGEKWLQGDDETWYYITPDGLLWEWLGGAPINRSPVGPLSPATYETPALLYEAQPGGAPGTVSVSGSTLTIDPNAGFVGMFGIEATVSDGEDTDSSFFQVTVNPFNILGLGQTVAGKTYDQWTQSWFQWLVGDTVAPSSAFPFDFPLTDPIGADATDNQTDGDVFFVGGVFGSSAERTFSVPADKHLFIGLGVSFWTNSPGDDPNRGVVATRQTVNAISELALSVDQVDIPPTTLFGLRAGRENFSAAFAENNWFDLATGGLFPEGSTPGHTIDGYWAMLAPLPPGTHSIQLRSVASGTYEAEGGFTAEQIAGSTDVTIAFSQDVSLTVVVPEPAGNRVDSMAVGVVVTADRRTVRVVINEELITPPLLSAPAAPQWPAWSYASSVARERAFATFGEKDGNEFVMPLSGAETP